jgi:hypothetical protein
MKRLALLLLLLSECGCLYSRLLAFKDQLAEFDRYMDLRDDNGLTIAFREPVLHPSDIVDMTGLPPTVISSNAWSQTWAYVYVNHARAGTAEGTDGDGSLVFRLGIENGKVCRVMCSQKIVALLGREFIVAAARSLGQARINQKEYTIDWQLSGGGAPLATVPNRASIAALLGKASREAVTDSGIKVAYVYELQCDRALPEKANNKVQATFDFGRGDERLEKAHITVGRAKFILNVGAAARADNPPAPPSLPP